VVNHAGRTLLDGIAPARQGRGVVTLYSAQFRVIVGATVRHRRRGLVEVWVADGPTLSFRVTPEAAGALQAHVAQAAESR
jgi:hypothetical protein